MRETFAQDFFDHAGFEVHEAQTTLNEILITFDVLQMVKRLKFVFRASGECRHEVYFFRHFVALYGVKQSFSQGAVNGDAWHESYHFLNHKWAAGIRA